MSYDERQITAPLRICVVCKRAWFMTAQADRCMECEDKYASHKAKDSRLYAQGNYMGGYGD